MFLFCFAYLCHCTEPSGEASYYYTFPVFHPRLPRIEGTLKTSHMSHVMRRNGVRAKHDIIQAICGGRPGQLEGPSVFLLVPLGGGGSEPILGFSPSKSPRPVGYCQNLI